MITLSIEGAITVKHGIWNRMEWNRTIYKSLISAKLTAN